METQKPLTAGITLAARKPYMFIATHRRMDADEGFARWMILKFPEIAEKVLPGSTTAELMDFTENVLPDGATEANYPHILFIGCGKGRFDEHKNRKSKECSATRVAEALGLRKHPQLARLIRMTQEEDRGLAYTTNGFNDAVKLVSQMWVETPSRTYRWLSDAYDALFENDIRLHANGQLNEGKHLSLQAIERIFRKKYGDEKANAWFKVYQDATAQRETAKREAREIWKGIAIEDYNLHGMPMSVAVVHSNNTQVNHVGYSEKGVGILIQVTGEIPAEGKKPARRGNVQIYTQQKRKVCLSQVAAALRRREFELEALQPENQRKDEGVVAIEAMPSDAELSKGDTLESMPKWHLLVGQDEVTCPILFNGNQITAPGVTPTLIPVDEIKETVIKALGLQKGKREEPMQNMGEAFAKLAATA